MELIFKKIEDLHSYNEHLRIKNDVVNMLFESIQEFGFINPIIINKNNLVISGEARLQAAKLLQMNTVPCIVINHLTEEQEKIYRLVDNKTSELAYWNYKRLNDELNAINKNLFKYDLVSDDVINVDLSEFFEGDSVEQISLFGEE